MSANNMGNGASSKGLSLSRASKAPSPKAQTNSASHHAGDQTSSLSSAINAAHDTAKYSFVGFTADNHSHSDQSTAAGDGKLIAYAIPEAPQVAMTPAHDRSSYDSTPHSLAFAVGSAPATVTQVAASTFAVTAGGITFDLIFDAAAMGAPAAFRTGIEQAASLLASVISDKITVNLNIDWSGTGGGAAAGPDSGLFKTYAQVRSLLLNSATPGDTTFNALPNTTTIQGQTNVAVWNAQLKALGLMAANATTTDDGSAFFATDINTNLLVGVALHELTHALGRVPYGAAPDIFDLFRFTAPGVRLFTGGSTAAPAYFSLDGGVTKLADFGRTSDPSDFLNSGVQGANDPFNEYYTGNTTQALSAVDLKLINALGFHMSGSTPAASPDLSVSNVSVTGTTINLMLNNSGLGAAGASTTGLYLANHTGPTTADMLVGTFANAGLGAGATQAEGLAIKLPANIAAGTYYLAAIADKGAQVAEINETNNTSSSLTVKVGDAAANTMSGANAIMYGLAGNDSITGTSGNNVMIGGAGNDTLYSSTGNDQFVFNSTADGTDTIRRFHAGDHIDFAAAGFGHGLATGGAETGILDASHFTAGTASPTTLAQEFWYNTTDHTLYFDADGSGSVNQAVAVAVIANGFLLHNTDLLVI